MFKSPSDINTSTYRGWKNKNEIFMVVQVQMSDKNKLQFINKIPYIIYILIRVLHSFRDTHKNKHSVFVHNNF